MAPERAQEAETALRQILEQIPQGDPEDPDRQFLQGLVSVAEGYNSISKDHPAESEEPSEPRDLVQETFDLLGNLREPTAEEKEILENNGFVFFTVEAKSLEQVNQDSRQYIDYLHPSEKLRAYTSPQEFVVAIKPSELRLAESNNSSQGKQLKMITEYSQNKLEKLVPSAKAVMLPATGYAQADIEFQRTKDGQKLFPDFWARALDATVDSFVAHVGRGHPGYGLRVGGWSRAYGFHRVWAVPAVVFPRK